MRVIVIGRGTPTPRQVELLAKALGTNTSEIEIITTIEQLTSPNQLISTINQHGAQAVLSLVLHPSVISILQNVHKTTGVPYFVVQTEAVTTTEVSSKEEAEELANKLGADILNLKVLPNGAVSARLLRTKALLKNPILKIEAEEVIE